MVCSESCDEVFPSPANLPAVHEPKLPQVFKAVDDRRGSDTVVGQLTGRCLAPALECGQCDEKLLGDWLCAGAVTATAFAGDDQAVGTLRLLIHRVK